MGGGHFCYPQTDLIRSRGFDMLPEIALIDCNNFFASCEQLFRPDLEGRPVVVLSSNDGCIIARNPEAKALGIRMGTPWFQIAPWAMTQDVHVFSSNFGLYADISNRVMETLARFSPIQERYSIDECFLDLSGLLEPATQAQVIRQTLWQEIGMPVCVGIAPTKTLAKIANHVAKQHPRSSGVFHYTPLSSSQKEKLLQHIPLNEIWGIGRRWTTALLKEEIYTALDLKRAAPKAMRTRYGVVMEKIILELNECCCLEVEDTLAPSHQICVSRSFGKLTETLPDLQNAITHFITQATQKLRKQHSLASTVSLFLCTDRFRHELPQYHPEFTLSFPEPSQDTLLINRYAMQALDHIFRAGYAYRRGGITLGGLTDCRKQQQSLFTEVNRTHLMHVMDKLNMRFGKGTLRLSHDHHTRYWQARSQFRSPAWTLDWNALPVCH